MEKSLIQTFLGYKGMLCLTPDLPESFHSTEREKLCVAFFDHFSRFMHVHQKVAGTEQDNSQIDLRLLASFPDMNRMDLFLMHGRQRRMVAKGNPSCGNGAFISEGINDISKTVH
jgi:hypothetical protein